MSELNVGFNFTEESFDEIIKQGVNKVTSVYGSNKEYAYLSARPDYRIPDITLTELIDWANKFKNYEIDFWFTANTIDIGPKNILEKENIISLINTLNDNGIKLIVADTMLLEVIKRARINIPVELSTIMRIDSPRQLMALKDQYPFIEKMVMHINYNRSFNTLNQFIKSAKISNIKLELLANELCTTGYYQSSTTCIHRDSCYRNHGHNKTINDAMLMHNYPLNKCISKRYKVNELTFPFILPQHFIYYNAIGINNFKLTGRTATNEFIKRVLPQYIDGNYTDPIMGLWKSIESINSESAEESNTLGIKALEIRNYFMEGFVHKQIECHLMLCNINCNHCFDKGVKYDTV